MDDDALQRRAADLARRIENEHGWVNAGFTDTAGIMKLLDVPERTLRDWRRRGDFPQAYKVHRLLFDLLEVAEWLERRKQKVTGEDRRLAANTGEW